MWVPPGVWVFLPQGSDGGSIPAKDFSHGDGGVRKLAQI